MYQSIPECIRFNKVYQNVLWCTKVYQSVPKYRVRKVWSELIWSEFFLIRSFWKLGLTHFVRSEKIIWSEKNVPPKMTHFVRCLYFCLNFLVWSEKFIFLTEILNLFIKIMFGQKICHTLVYRKAIYFGTLKRIGFFTWTWITCYPILLYRGKLLHSS